MSHWIQYQFCTQSAPPQLPGEYCILARRHLRSVHMPNQATNNFRILLEYWVPILYTWMESSNVDKVSCCRTKSASNQTRVITTGVKCPHQYTTTPPQWMDGLSKMPFLYLFAYLSLVLRPKRFYQVLPLGPLSLGDVHKHSVCLKHFINVLLSVST